jgi:hypothetical protein
VRTVNGRVVDRQVIIGLTFISLSIVEVDSFIWRILLPYFLDPDVNTLALRVQEDGHLRFIFKLNLEVNDEAALFATDNKLGIVTALMKVDDLDQADGHPLPVDEVEVLIKYDELEVFGASEVQVVNVRVAQAQDGLDGVHRLRLIKIDVRDQLHRLRVP